MIKACFIGIGGFMWIADKWKDYEVLDTDNKEKLEKWGDYILIRPDPQVIWHSSGNKDLWRKAAEQNVYIADEQSLYGALKIVRLTWTQVAQAQNHEKVYELANEMIDRVGQFMDRYEAMGKALEKARLEYDNGMRKLTPQGQSIINTSGKLIRLGAKNSDKHPIRALSDIDDIPQLQE